MDKLHIRLTSEDVELLADVLECAPADIRWSGHTRRLDELQARLRYLLARARQRATRTPAT